jgi:polar amino acid transport system substrate-binding protein
MRTRILSSLALATTTVTPAISFADEISLMADIWCPYNCEPGSKNPGIFIEVATQALEAKGHKVKYSILPWARALADARAGKITGVVGAGEADKEGLEMVDYMGESSNCFFVPKGSKWTFQGAASLENITFAAITDYTYSDEIDGYIADKKNAKRVDVIGGDDALEKNIKKVASSRVDAFIEDTNVTNYTAAKLGVADKIQQAGCAKSVKISAAFSKKNPKAKEYQKIVNDHLAAIKKDGRFDALKKKYKMN